MVSYIADLRESFSHYRKSYELYYNTNEINNRIDEEKITKLNNIMLNLYGTIQKSDISDKEILQIINTIPDVFDELFLEVSKLSNNSNINEFKTNLTNCYSAIHDAAEKLNSNNINNFNKSHI